MSASTVEEAVRAQKDGADYLGLGAMFLSLGIGGLAVISTILTQPDIRLAAAELQGIFIHALS